MPFDGLVLSAVRKELEEKITGGRIERVYQPAQDELVLLVHRPGRRSKLLLSANARNAGVYLTTNTRENPAAPPLFCMVLRKHLEGGRLQEFKQHGLERVLVIKVNCRDELGRPAQKHLVCEIMAKHSNIILVEPSTDTIIDGIKRYSHAVSRYREVLPGRTYLPPPAQNKLNPLIVDEEQFRRACLEMPLDTTLPVLLQRSFEGFSTVTCREIVYRSNLEQDLRLNYCGEHELRALWETLRSIINPARREYFEPCLTTGEKGTPLDFAALDLRHAHTNRKHGEMNIILDIFFTYQQQRDKFNSLKKVLVTTLKKETTRLEKKLDLYAEKMADTAGTEKLRLYGELLTANIYRLKKGLRETTVENFYEEGSPPVTIKLKPHLTPVENTQFFFRKYLKAKNTREALETITNQVGEELSYLEGIKTSLDLAEELSGLAWIKQELQEQGYLKQPAPDPAKRKNKTERQLPLPSSFTSSDGFQLLVGRNNKQNDYLTLKLAKGTDIWLHAKDIPGAHVIIKTEGKNTVTPATLAEAAGLAAYFSKGQAAKTVPVDYTLKKHVRKPKGARPGMVIYDHQKTIMAAPAAELAAKPNTAE
jgi:predicted ribosome quality control (RQC) complex YloA/Tae2 family protein